MSKERVKEVVFGIVIMIVLAMLVGYVMDFLEVRNIRRSTSPSFTDYKQPLQKDIISCEFKVISYFFYEAKDMTSGKNRKVYYEINKEKNPNVITFSGLSTTQPQLKGNIGTAPLTILRNDDEVIVLAETTSFGDMFLFTIYKKERVAVWQKSYKIVGTPAGMLSMGYCY